LGGAGSPRERFPNVAYLAAALWPPFADLISGAPRCTCRATSLTASPALCALLREPVAMKGGQACTHSFCRECLVGSLQNARRCPTCRAKARGGGEEGCEGESKKSPSFTSSARFEKELSTVQVPADA